MWELFFCVDSTQILLLKLKTTINRVSLYISAEDSRNWDAAWPSAKTALTAIVMARPQLGWRMPLRWWPRKWQMQIKQLRWRQNSTINYLKATNGSEDDGRCVRVGAFDVIVYKTRMAWVKISLYQPIPIFRPQFATSHSLNFDTFYLTNLSFWHPKLITHGESWDLQLSSDFRVWGSWTRLP